MAIFSSVDKPLITLKQHLPRCTMNREEMTFYDGLLDV